jgi:hypothetical protein
MFRLPLGRKVKAAVCSDPFPSLSPNIGFGSVLDIAYMGCRFFSPSRVARLVFIVSMT